MSSKELWAGIDVGSTTVKTTVVDPENGAVLFREYRRHNAHQASCFKDLIKLVKDKFEDLKLRVAVCGSGGQPFAKKLGLPFVQEVVANSLAVRELYPDTKVAIELGGQDAKVIFFERDPVTGELVTSDMRMNGSCAGGTGAFIDQIAELLDIDTTEFNALASQGTQVYDISGRCGVFAKTDIQPLLNQGVNKSDIALSSLHAIAKQTIGGLAQGMEIHPPVLFEGGPLTFNPMLVKVFQQRLGLSGEQAMLPEQAETLVAMGAALSFKSLFTHGEGYLNFSTLDLLDEVHAQSPEEAAQNIKISDGLFANSQEHDEFVKAHPLDLEDPAFPPAGTVKDVWLGIDAGSTTTKFVLLDDEGEVFASHYASNGGEPLTVLKKSLCELHERITSQGVTVNIKGVGTTGYGEILMAKALVADHHMVETVAHARAAQELVPDVSFILDIGGQDMKAIGIQDGVVNGIILNEACSSGCGSFIETYAKSLGIPVSEVATKAFQSHDPSRLGSRCTVFMNSSIITEQRDGKKPEDIMAGLCLSVIENVFTKVVRLRNLSQMGDKVVVQGGTFRNDAVLRAFELYTGIRPHRPTRPGLMGAIGIALLTRDRMKERAVQSEWIGWDELKELSWTIESGQICTFCTNNCNRTIVRFANGMVNVTGNRCERGEVIPDESDPDSTKEKLKEISSRIGSIKDLLKEQPQTVFKKRETKVLTHSHHTNPSFSGGLTIGIPRVLEFWSSFPFWQAFFTSLGHKVVLSKPSNYELFERGLSSVPSDTICFPAKLAHGHVMDLADKEVDRIFFPMMITVPSEHAKEENPVTLCPVVQGYPMIVREQDNPLQNYQIPLDQPIFHWTTKLLRKKQTIDWFSQNWGLSKLLLKKAVNEAEKALESYWKEQENRGAELLKDLKNDDDFAVVIAGRPYHADPLVNHSISSHFTQMGIPVMSVESVPGIHEQELGMVTRMELYNSYHCRLLAAARIVAKNPKLQLVQIVSFGCGHDAIITDETSRLLREEGGKELLVVKLDEGEVKGPLGIRVKSFVETVKTRMEANVIHQGKLPLPFAKIFQKEDVKKRTILIPNLNHGFAILTSAVFNSMGYKTVPMPIADKRAIELGKRYVHNDICFPAQINIGEELAWLERHPELSQDSVAIGLAKNCDSCRAGQYSALARRALDEAGYTDVPIVTTGEDTKNMHPGFRPGAKFMLNMAWGIALLDRLEAMVRAVRPYELIPGESNKVHELYLDKVLTTLPVNRKKALKYLEEGVEAFNAIKVDRSVRKPRVGVLGEILMKYHPAANGYVEDYLENNGMEVVQPGMLDFFRRAELIRLEKVKRGFSENPFVHWLIAVGSETYYNHVVKTVDKIFKKFKWKLPHADCYEMADRVGDMVDKTYVAGEGWLIPAEILYLAEDGVESFVVVQPFGCLANHISGRGLTQAVRKKAPNVQVLSLDYDPDTSMANIENRLQMLVIRAKARQLAEEQQKSS